MHKGQEKDGLPPEFYDVADRFINLASEPAESWPSSRISPAILYAAARHNAFNFHALEAAPGASKESAVEYYCEQYENMLLNNLDDFSAGGSPL